MSGRKKYKPCTYYNAHIVMGLQGLDVGQILVARISHPYGHLMANFSTSLNHLTSQCVESFLTGLNWDVSKKKQKSETKEMNATPPKLQVPCKCITLCVFCLVLRLALSIGRVNKVRLILFSACCMLWQLLFLSSCHSVAASCHLQ